MASPGTGGSRALNAQLGNQGALEAFADLTVGDTTDAGALTIRGNYTQTSSGILDLKSWETVFPSIPSTILPV